LKAASLLLAWPYFKPATLAAPIAASSKFAMMELPIPVVAALVIRRWCTPISVVLVD
jgi:hypothetical protein